MPDDTRVEQLREFGCTSTVIGATEEEMVLALFRGLQDPEEVLVKPYSTKYHGKVLRSGYKTRSDKVYERADSEE